MELNKIEAFRDNNDNNKNIVFLSLKPEHSNKTKLKILGICQ